MSLREAVYGFVNQYTAHLESVNPDRHYSFDDGKIYLKVWWCLQSEIEVDVHHKGEVTISKKVPRYVVCFVRKHDGMMFRADSWKKRGRQLAPIQQWLVLNDQRQQGVF